MAVFFATAAIRALRSAGATFFFKGQQFYEASAVLLVFILLGHWLEMRARAVASEAIGTVLDLAPAIAVILCDGREIEIPTVEVLVGDTVVIRPGNKILVDGTVTEGMGTGLGAMNGILFKNAGALEDATNDKTGTLTLRTRRRVEDPCHEGRSRRWLVSHPILRRLRPLNEN